MMLKKERHKEREAICFCPALIGYIPCDGFILKEFCVSVEECVGLFVYMRDTATISGMYIVSISNHRYSTVGIH